MGVKAIPKINVTLSGANTTLTGYISGYGAGISDNGTLIIWMTSNTTSYEHFCFINTSIGAGTIKGGWNITAFDTGDPTEVPQACTITGLGNYSTINISLYVADYYASNDYLKVQVTLTAS